MSNERKIIRIGQATIAFDEKGIAKLARFVPEAMEFNTVDMIKQIMGLLTPIEGGKGKQGIQSSAELIFGAWFNQMNEIELANRDEYEIVSEVVECEEYPDGTAKSCTILFTFREREDRQVKSAFSAN